MRTAPLQSPKAGLDGRAVLGTAPVYPLGDDYASAKRAKALVAKHIDFEGLTKAEARRVLNRVWHRLLSEARDGTIKCRSEALQAIDHYAAGFRREVVSETRHRG